MTTIHRLPPSGAMSGGSSSKVYSSRCFHTAL